MNRTAWVVASLVLILVLGIAAVRFADRSPQSERPHEFHSEGTPQLLTPEEHRELERLATLGYLAGADPVPHRTGVLIHEPETALAGLTLYTGGEGPIAYLIDMEGNVVHSWSYPGSEGWPRVRAQPNGDLLAITTFPPQMLRLNRDSELLWQYDEHAHHDFAVLPDGTICVLVRSQAVRPDLNGGEPVIDDNVVLLDEAGQELAFISLLKAFERSQLGTQWLIEHPLPDDEDIFHTNSIDVVYRDGRMHLLLSIRSIDTVALLDVASGKIVWALAGRWHMQHEAQLVNGNLLLFDNLGPTSERDGRKQSRVIEIDLDTGELAWSFTEPGFFTRSAGAQQRLGNGNTLITESEAGRIIEVTPEGRIVWDYISPKVVEGRPDVVLAVLRAERKCWVR